MNLLEWRDGAHLNMLIPEDLNLSERDTRELVRYCKSLKSATAQVHVDALRYQAKRILSFYVASEMDAKRVIKHIVSHV
jgi:hypothetical protein